MEPWLEWVFMGIVGALANYLFIQLINSEKEWHIVLPSYKDGKLYLGVLLVLFLGGVAGWFGASVIGNGTNSFLAGFTFASVFDGIAKSTRKPVISP